MIFQNSRKIESGAPKNYISTKTLATDPQKHLQKNNCLIRKVIFSTKNFLSSRTEIDWIYKKNFVTEKKDKIHFYSIFFVLLFLKVALIR